jgi:hypothetical protein
MKGVELDSLQLGIEKSKSWKKDYLACAKVRLNPKEQKIS